MRVLEAIKAGSKLLKEKNISTYILDSELLLSKSLKKSREEILINLEQHINEKVLLDFNNYLLRRSKKEPIAYLLGEKEFWSRKFFVNKETLIEIAGPLDCHSYGQSVETALIESGEVSNFDAERAGIEAYFACEGANDLIDAFVDAWNYFF